MKRLLAAIAVAGLLSSAQGANVETGGVIGGVVRNGWSKAPIKRAIVTLTTNGTDPLEALTYSDSNGAFAFTGVPQGEYYLCARVSGYERACFGGGGGPGKPVLLLALRPGEKKQDVILPMLPTGSVSGVVLDPDGDPVSNANVTLLRPIYARRSLHWQVAGQASTDDRGEYHLSYVVPGEYRLMAARQYQQAVLIRPEAVAGQPIAEQMYTPQFYPGSGSMSGAASLTLNAGNDLKGIDFTLGTTPQVTVKGVVQIPAGMPKDTPVNLTFTPEFQVGGNQGIGAGAGPPDYRFETTLAAGRYHLTAFASAEDRSYRAEQVVDAGAAVDNVSISLLPGTPLAGKLTVEGETAREHGPYSVTLTPGDELPFNGQPPTTEVDKNGSFEFPSVLSGIWDIGVSPMPPGSYIKSMYLGDQDVLTDDMTLTEGPRKALKIVMSLKGGTVSGNVTQLDSAGHPSPVTSLRPRLLLAPSGKFEHVLSFYETTLADSKGHFEFKSVTPGTYKIYAFDRLRLDEYWKPDFLAPFAAGAGDAFEIGESARVVHDATLIVREPGGGE